MVDTYRHEVANIPLSEVSQKNCSILVQEDPLMNCTALPKAAKPALAKQLARLPCLVEYVNNR